MTPTVRYVIVIVHLSASSRLKGLKERTKQMNSKHLSL